jgi:hypothetical protein
VAGLHGLDREAWLRLRGGAAGDEEAALSGKLSLLLPVHWITKPASRCASASAWLLPLIAAEGVHEARNLVGVVKARVQQHQEQLQAQREKDEAKER